MARKKNVWKPLRFLAIALLLGCLATLLPGSFSASAKEVAPTGIQLNKEILTVPIGGYRTLKAKYLPKKATGGQIKWSSSDKRLAIVDANGVVKGKRKGTVTITASSPDGKLSASCLVTVKRYPTSVSIDVGSLTLEVGEKKTLTATVLPASANNTKVWWTTSDEGVATVNSKGKVTGVSAGSAVITATTRLGKLQVTCPVTVKDVGHWTYDSNGDRSGYVQGGKAVKGLYKVGNSYYFFDSKGKLKTGLFLDGARTYFAEYDGTVVQYKQGSSYYAPDGSSIDGYTGYNTETFFYAKNYVGQITTPGMTQSQKLYACFAWVAGFAYITPRDFTFQWNWVPLYANDVFLGNGGTCQSYAAAFGYLAKAIGYKNVYVCLDDDKDVYAHSWTEIDGLCYDPLFYRAKGTQYYALPYSGWNEWPVVKVRLS